MKPKRNGPLLLTAFLTTLMGVVGAVSAALLHSWLVLGAFLVATAVWVARLVVEEKHSK
jgi:hypothetical protein